MKKRIILAVSVLLVFGLAIVVFAYNRSNHSSHQAEMSCCCKDGSCPMKNKDAASTADMKDCCDMPDCCCKGGESCPMKKQGETSQTTSVDMKNVTVAAGDENCCCACCKNKKQG